MSVPTLPQDPLRTEPSPPSEGRLEARLDAIEEQVERGNREGRRSGRAFMFFAATALGIALVNLIAVAAKLDGTSTPARASRPATTPTRTIPPAAPHHTPAPPPRPPGRRPPHRCGSPRVRCRPGAGHRPGRTRDIRGAQ